MAKFFDTNYNITKIVTSNGDITELELNGKEVELSSDIALEDNKTATIDVSTYSSPVEITPTAGKDAMKKATVTLSNIPVGGNTAYSWSVSESVTVYLSVDEAPTAFTGIKALSITSTEIQVTDFVDGYPEGSTITKDSDTQFTVTYEENDETKTDVYVRDDTLDFTLW